MKSGLKILPPLPLPLLWFVDNTFCFTGHEHHINACSTGKHSNRPIYHQPTLITDPDSSMNPEFSFRDKSMAYKS